LDRNFFEGLARTLTSLLKIHVECLAKIGKQFVSSSSLPVDAYQFFNPADLPFDVAANHGIVVRSFHWSPH